MDETQPPPGQAPSTAVVPLLTDICLILRSHCEQRWLSSQLIPVLADLERRGVPDEQLGAALAYLEVLWIDARRRARETEEAYDQLSVAQGYDRDLHESALQYHDAVRMLRHQLGERVDALTAAPSCS